MAINHKTRPGGRLTGAHKRHTIHNRYTISAVAGEAQGSTMLWMLTRTKNSDSD